MVLSVTSVAISTAFERRLRSVERLATTPLGKPGLLAGKALAVIMILLAQLVIWLVLPSASAGDLRSHPFQRCWPWSW